MRKINKFKIYKYLSRSTAKLSLRVLKFRRPKWFKIQKNIKYKKKSRLLNFFLIKRKFKFWDRLKKNYKMSLFTKKQYQFLFDGLASLSKSKKKQRILHIKKNFFFEKFAKPEYRLNILLWNLHFTNSVHMSKKLVESKQFSVNGKSIGSIVFLKKGDVVTFKSNFTLDLAKNIKKYFFFAKLLSFVEIDYYSCSFIVIKESNLLSVEDLYLLLKEDININYLTGF
jgi:ribosomal protein S4